MRLEGNKPHYRIAETPMRVSTNIFLNLVFSLLLISGCSTTNHNAAVPGVMSLGKMNVTIGTDWFRVPAGDTPEKRSSSRVYSRSSLDSDRLMLIPGISDGQAVFKSDNESSSLLFSADMSVQQIADLVAQSMQQSLWNGQSKVSVANAREHGFTGIPGFKFDLNVALPGGQNQQGIAGGFVHEDRLYVNIFVAESPAHFEQHEGAAQQVIDSAVLQVRTIRMSAVLDVDEQLVVSR
jgi:hypothetical protein